MTQQLFFLFFFLNFWLLKDAKQKFHSGEAPFQKAYVSRFVALRHSDAGLGAGSYRQPVNELHLCHMTIKQPAVQF